LLPDDLDKFFEGFGKSDLAGFTPAVNVYQTRDEVAVEAPLPGVDPDKVEVTVEHDVLTIQGHTEQKTEVDEKSYYRREVRSGSFYRSVPLPAAVEADKAEATYEQGILKVRIPKTPEAKPKTIAVKSPRP
jgi:HSP20 family protein